MTFSWVPFFNELFLKIVNEYNPKTLAELAYAIFPEKGLLDRDEQGSQFRLTELEPCTFLARFNRVEKLETKKAFCEKAKSILNLRSNVPSNFDGIPTFNNQNSWLFPFQKDRSGNEFSILWTFCKSLATGELDESAFNAALSVKYTGAAYLTMICYLVWPDRFLPLDGKTRTIIQTSNPEIADLFNLKKSNNPYSEYMQIMDGAKRIFPGKSFCEISYQAWQNSESETEDDDFGVNEDTTRLDGTNYWTISPGERAFLWDDWKANDYISIGWDELGDLREYSPLKKMQAYYVQYYSPEKTPINNARACYEFAHELRIGDIVFAKRGLLKILGVGRVISDYEFHSDRKEHKHIRKVQWLQTGDWVLPEKLRMAVKALTNITQYEGFPESLAAAIGIKNLQEISSLANPAFKNGNSSGNQVGSLTLSNLNTIYYGPPGTGKTYQLIEWQKAFRDSNSGKDDIIAWVQDHGWWETIAAALIDLERPVTVPELYQHEFIQVKVKQQSGNKSPKNTLWGQLQAHTVTASKTVNFERRQEPLVVDKTPDSKWSLVGNWAEQLEDLVADVRRIRTGKGDVFNERFKVVTFHQSYSYEEFVEGIRPEIMADGSGISYKVKDGVFKLICQRAIANPKQSYAIFIDEINRGNISKIFGELITLIEEDKRLRPGHEITVTLPYSGERFGVPANLYIIGTMNSVDRSIALVDMALRRRFEFISVRPDSRLINPPTLNGVDIRKIFEKMNQKISVILGTEYQIGHSYFMGKNVVSIQMFKKTWFGFILPLLQEYLFDDWDKLEAIVGEFVQKTDVKGLERLPLPRFSFGAFLNSEISDEQFIELLKKLE